jgi:hypothetical protein
MKPELKKMIFVLATMPKVIIKHIIAVLNLRKYRKINAYIAKVKLVRQSMDRNSWFPAPPVDVTVGGTFDNNISDLDIAETKALTRVIGAAQDRDVKKGVVDGNLNLLKAYVQSVADANPKEAEAIIISAGFDVKRIGKADKDDLSVKPKKGESGTMIARARKVQGTIANLWEYTIDDGVNWNELEATSKCSTEITGLTPGDTIIVRHRPILRKGKGTWIQSAPAIVV